MRLTYARIVTEDVPSLARFYQALIGIPPAGNEHYAVFQTAAGALAISSEAIMDVHGAGAAEAGANRSVILDFEVQDVDEQLPRILALVSTLVQGPTDLPWGNRSILFRDPDGNLINLYSSIAIRHAG